MIRVRIAFILSVVSNGFGKVLPHHMKIAFPTAKASSSSPKLEADY